MLPAAAGKGGSADQQEPRCERGQPRLKWLIDHDQIAAFAFKALQRYQEILVFPQVISQLLLSALDVDDPVRHPLERRAVLCNQLCGTLHLLQVDGASCLRDELLVVAENLYPRCDVLP